RDSILELGGLLAKTGQAAELGGLLKYAARLVRSLLDLFLDHGGGHGAGGVSCVWSASSGPRPRKRTFLRQALEVTSFRLGSQLLQELKKMDDKALLVEVQLLESKTYHALSNLPKARAALTSARTTANASTAPPNCRQHWTCSQESSTAAEEKDWKTIMLMPEDVQALISGKLALRYAGRQTDSLKCVALASQNRSLADFEQALTEYKSELRDDPIISTHLTKLYHNLLEQNLIRVIEPFSRVQVDILDQGAGVLIVLVLMWFSCGSVSGILDQGAGVLIVFEEPVVDQTYESALETIHNMSKVVDSLYNKAKKLT
uniref:Proteasome 26S subunit, non-ATPase 11a n=1 Tax=Sphaeramia orbicularis TaxID=375764 RepID=A0A673BN69_9TELE